MLHSVEFRGVKESVGLRQTVALECEHLATMLPSLTHIKVVFSTRKNETNQWKYACHIALMASHKRYFEVKLTGESCLIAYNEAIETVITVLSRTIEKGKCRSRLSPIDGESNWSPLLQAGGSQ